MNGSNNQTEPLKKPIPPQKDVPSTQPPLPNNQQPVRRVFDHKKDLCKPYCKLNGSDEKCALICTKPDCNKFGHYEDVCGKNYCGECNSTDHRFNKNCKK
jgi:hypothetical protein